MTSTTRKSNKPTAGGMWQKTGDFRVLIDVIFFITYREKTKTDQKGASKVGSESGAEGKAGAGPQWKNGNQTAKCTNKKR